jgi:hypothetical protein
VWALRYNDPGLSKKSNTSIGSGLKYHVATDTLYVFGDTDLYGTYDVREPTECNPFILKLNANPTTPTTTETDTSGLFKQTSIASSITITDITSTMTIEQADPVVKEENATQTSDPKPFTADTWANKKVVMNQSSLYYTVYPDEDVTTDADVQIRDDAGTNVGEATYYYQAVTNIGDYVAEYISLGIDAFMANHTCITTWRFPPQSNTAAAIVSVSAGAVVNKVKGNTANNAGFYFTWQPGGSGDTLNGTEQKITATATTDPPATPVIDGVLYNVAYNPNTNDYWHWSETGTTIAGIVLTTGASLYEAVGCNEYTLIWTYEMRPDPCSIKVAGVKQPRKMMGKYLYDPTGSQGGFIANKIGGVNWWQYPDDDD